jgi:4'-phosphopantetheinyl transferase
MSLLTDRMPTAQTMARIQVIRLARGELDHVRLDVLSPDEEARFALQSARPDADFVKQVRAALKIALGRCLAAPPGEIRFSATSDGKPFIDPRQSAGWAFNVSHSDRTALLAIGRARAIGIDVEDMDEEMDWSEIVDLTFSPEDAAKLREMDPETGRRAFFRGWTRKEAVAKAMGTGLLTDPRELDVPITDTFVSTVTTPNGAQLKLQDVSGDGYLAALAVDAVDLRVTRMTLDEFLRADPR